MTRPIYCHPMAVANAKFAYAVILSLQLRFDYDPTTTFARTCFQFDEGKKEHTSFSS